LQEFSNKIQLSQPAVLNDSALPADAEMMEMLHRLVHMPYSINIQMFHVDLLKELLFKTLNLSAQTFTPHLKFSMQLIEAVQAAKEFIDTHLPHHFSITQIARRAGLNEQILKAGFKEIYGLGLYSYLQQQVLNIAKKQLEETNKSAKEIAFEAGYKNANNFSAAFKKKFGKAPLEWRKKFK
jgi:AraC-like DNA-binding protein